jgi:hypothetical protein
MRSVTEMNTSAYACSRDGLAVLAEGVGFGSQGDLSATPRERPVHAESKSKPLGEDAGENKPLRERMAAEVSGFF